MHLLLSRSQSNGYFSLIPLRIGLGTIFRLKAELELDEEEFVLLNQYGLGNATLVTGSRWQALKRAFGSGVIVAALVFVAIQASYGVSPYRSSYGFGFSLIPGSLSSLVLPLFITAIMTAIYYFNEREDIKVSDLRHGGRTFRCDSVVTLIQKEAFLENICEYLRQVLESAKHWQDREAVAIEPLDKDMAKQFVLQVSRA